MFKYHWEEFWWALQLLLLRHINRFKLHVPFIVMCFTLFKWSRNGVFTGPSEYSSCFIAEGAWVGLWWSSRFQCQHSLKYIWWHLYTLHVYTFVILIQMHVQALKQLNGVVLLYTVTSDGKYIHPLACMETGREGGREERNGFQYVPSATAQIILSVPFVQL